MISDNNDTQLSRYVPDGFNNFTHACKPKKNNSSNVAGTFTGSIRTKAR